MVLFLCKILCFLPISHCFLLYLLVECKFVLKPLQDNVSLQGLCLCSKAQAESYHHYPELNSNHISLGWNGR